MILCVPMATKIDLIKQKFSSLKSPDERYGLIIQMGRALLPLPPDQKIPANIVPGCQSTLHLAATLSDNKLFFSAASDALISAGLAALLIEAFNGCTPEEILRSSSSFLQELGITASLSPNRSNGLGSIYLKMKQIALKNIKIL